MALEDYLKPISKIYEIGITYMNHRKSGIATSVRTPWKAINYAGVNGFEWGTIITLAGRPGSGKTTFANQFTRAAHDLNPNAEFHVIDFQFEMPDKQTALREFSAATGIKYNELLSAHRPIGDNVIDDVKQYINKNKHKKIFIVDTPITVNQIKALLIAYIQKYDVPLIVTIDHSLLVKLDAKERDKFEMLYNLGEMMTELKKQYSIIFIVMTQMNRSIEDASRKVNGSVANYPTAADIFGADALVQHSDMVLILNRPATSSIREYGPCKYQVMSDTVFCHFVKVRNGENMMGFFKFHGGQARFEEIPTPPNICSSKDTDLQIPKDSQPSYPNSPGLRSISATNF